MADTKIPTVYIMANKRNGTLYMGVTSNLLKRIHEHKNGISEGFTARYQCKILVYYVLAESMEAAILEEKRIKAGNRKQKLNLIESINLDWRDLYEEII